MDFAGVAVAFGCAVYRVERAGELAPALSAAFCGGSAGGDRGYVRPDGRRAAFLGAWVAGANLPGGGLIMLRRLIVCAVLSVAAPLYGSMAARIWRRSEVLRGDRSRASTLLYILFGYTNVEPSSAG